MLLRLNLQTLAASVLFITGLHAYNVQVINKCAAVKNMMALQQMSGAIIPLSKSVSVASGRQTSFSIPFKAKGVKITAHGEYSNHWQVQSLAEFGYAAGWAGGPSAGIAYDVSVMTGSSEGVTIRPWKAGCQTKSCPNVRSCPADQGWTNPNQSNIGSPADTVCYNGETDFTVTFCG